MSACLSIDLGVPSFACVKSGVVLHTVCDDNDMLLLVQRSP